MNRKDKKPLDTPIAQGDLIPDAAVMFPDPNPDVIDEKADESVGIKDPRTENQGPDVVSAPFAS